MFFFLVQSRVQRRNASELSRVGVVSSGSPNTHLQSRALSRARLVHVPTGRIHCAERVTDNVSEQSAECVARSALRRGISERPGADRIAQTGGREDGLRGASGPRCSHRLGRERRRFLSL